MLSVHTLCFLLQLDVYLCCFHPWKHLVPRPGLISVRKTQESRCRTGPLTSFMLCAMLEHDMKSVSKCIHKEKSFYFTQVIEIQTETVTDQW